MKYILLLTLGLMCILSCKKKVDDNSITEFAVSESINSITYNTDLLKSTVEREGNLKPDQRVLAFSQKLEGWRNAYSIKQNKVTLIAYSDSVLFWHTRTFSKGDQISKQVRNCKQQLKDSDDSTKRINLFFWTLEAEEELQNELFTHVGSSTDFFSPDWAGDRVELYLDKVNYQLNDTVYATFHIPKANMNNLKFDFNSLIVKPAFSKENIQRKIIKSGPLFIIQIIPRQKGKFQIEGDVKLIHHSGSEFRHYLAKSFIVN